MTSSDWGGLAGTDTDPDGRDGDTRRGMPGLVRSAAGVLLVVWGVELLLDALLPFDVVLVPLAIGLLLLAASQQRRSFGLYLAGTVVTGWGVGALLAGPVHGALHAALVAAGLGIGFLIPAVAHPSRAGWAVIPAAVAGFVALGAVGLHATSWLSHASARWTLPVLLVIAGSLLLLRGVVPSGMVRVGVIACIGAFALIAGNSGASLMNDFAGDSRIYVDTDIRLPSVDGRTIVIDSGSANVELATGPVVRAEALVRRLGPPPFRQGRFQDRPAVTVTESPSEVVIRPRTSFGGPFFGRGATTIRLTVPESTPVRVKTSSGNIRALQSRNAVVDLTSGSGNITAAGTFDKAGFRTGSGNVGLRLDEHSALEVHTGSGDITVNGTEEGDSYDADGDPTAGTVTVDTGSGDVTIAMAAVGAVGSAGLR